MKYVNVAIDNNTDHTDVLYTYGTELEEIQIGDKVKVPFARGNRVKDGYVFEIMDDLSEKIKGLKMVVSRDEEISLSKEAISTCIWMRKRYLCRYIDAVKCFTPAGSSSKRGKKRNPFSDYKREPNEAKQLTFEQKKAMDRIQVSMNQDQHEVFLIHGVTSSGKTELYMQAIEACLKSGKTAIMLVPEISLTIQTIERFINRFGNEQVAVLHSKLSLGERYDEWMRVKNGDVKIVIGARSGIFAPLDHIGIIILDEEHESTYKSDMSPKYDTFEVAVKRAMLNQSVVLLGSATPSIQSFYRAQEEKIQLIRLTERYNKMPLPHVEIVDMREELKNGNKSIFSITLYQEIRKCLEQKKQVILFLNRRGYSTFISCRNCGFVLECPDCGISMTYHKESDEACCHFCGTKSPVPTICPSCSSSYIKYFGMGTEKVEEKAGEIFEGANIARLDLDTVKKKGSIERVLKSFHKGKIDILIGTQLVAKGLDFANVGLVGIISADVSLNIPDYRSSERTFQLITQAAGRTGRGDFPGKVIIQSYTPQHYAIEAASHHDYEGFYQQELILRKQIGYPPFCDFFQLLISSENDQEAKKMAESIGTYLKEKDRMEAISIFGPQPAPIHRMSDRYRYQILIKAGLGTRKQYAREIAELKQTFFVKKKTKCLLSVDINPYSFL
ncbi:replication restart helicase PriA [Sinanaerobacter sp. ZZT-01]|uniref:replication restart helicase PriA n=1 Tax=Sinanaerobacter sp. ZZT-01 TaxID=3111540 RepID=UPI002D79FBED|nr:primosomal protein N' [Sinanaerobacter sp. ZZT-01]WRR92777.1 primosomal protein N' [Sinanaerobacter sp. ZZT-01]